ncbi:hypothetical protein Clacol_010310 [Clathrus columnatus]|uniref:Flavin-containing monooxygenase n=1 Tax=Clathrus columnatus TaxID=1419009 RepID=A0AAV5ATD5_9AGAM|nr:hypothetical protein Clacol_010310 [Clathrus columnatus]
MTTEPIQTHSTAVNGVHINGVINHPDISYQLGDFAIDEYRPVRIAVIGAGYSGILAGIRIPQRLKNFELVIYERESGIGGTWYVNRYPTRWSSFYAPGHEILAYLQKTASKYHVEKYVKLQHELSGAEWDEENGKWLLKLTTPDGEVSDAVDVVLNCTGGLSNWNWPDIPGLHDFEGTLVHSAKWTLEKEAWEGKTVAVIGVGSSAIQIVPALQPKAAKVSNFVRGKTWISAPFASREISIRNPGGETHYFTEPEMKEFENTEYYTKFRHDLEDELNAVHGSTQRGHPIQHAAAAVFREAMLRKLAKKPWIAEHLIPDFPVACRRLTPGPGYLEALCEDNVEFVTENIARITPEGIETIDGQHRAFDIIVCATGYDTTYRPRCSIKGRNGVDLQDKWKDFPVNYLSVATDGFPNWFYALGPNSAVGSGSLLVLIEKEIDYLLKIVTKLQRERLKFVEVKKEAVEDFDEYSKTVYSVKCRSWYKMGKEEGRIAGLWPGSTLHALKVFGNPRWEDFNYESADKTHNRFYWLGNGWTIPERDEVGDRAWYLDEIDYPPGS